MWRLEMRGDRKLAIRASWILLDSGLFSRKREIVQINNFRELSNRYVTVVRELCRLTYIARLDEWQGLDMTVPQIKTLVLLEYMGPLRMGAIASYLGSGLSTTTTIVDRLVRKQLVQRDSDPSDRRVVICVLTSQGRDATELFWEHIKTRALKVSDQWELEQFKMVVQALELILGTEEALQSTSDAIPTIARLTRDTKSSV